MNTISSRNMRNIVTLLDSIKELTDLLRRAHFEVPYSLVRNAACAEATIREFLLAAALSDITVEPIATVAKAKAA